ncbi:MAG: hypothetical protein IJY37_01010 [Clostridia bacterium]|nr:hypothetical protein [Clostridia bacterium]
MKKSLKRLLCLVLSVLLFTMSLPVLAADTTEETTTGTEENTTTETNLQGLDLLETLNPNKEVYNYVIVAEKPNKAKKELTWDDFKKALDKGEVGMSAKILLKTDVNLNEDFTFETTEGSGEVTISWGNNSVNVGVDGKVGASGWWADYITSQYKKSINSWTPIGTTEKPFTGVFNAFEYDENGNIIGMYDISGLMFNADTDTDTDTDNVGLFGVVDKGAIIAGVRVINSYVRGTNNVGAIVGHSKHGANIIGCVNGTGSVVIGTKNVGGVVGSFDVDHKDPDLDDDGNQDHIYECVNRGYVYGETNVGGIVGYTYHALIRDSYNVHANTMGSGDTTNTKYTGHVYGTKYVGGIVGRAVSTVICGCTNYGVVGLESTTYVGGIVGQLEQIRSYLREGVNARSATVTGKEYVGGIVGYLGETENNLAKDADGNTVTAALELFMAYNHGTVNGTDKVGGLVGYNATRGKVFNSYSSGPVLISDKATDNNGNIVGLNAGEVRDCFYYPNMYAKTVDDNENDLHEGNENAIGNGIGSNSASKKVYHVSGLKVLALKSEAAAYLLNLVYLENDDHNTGAGYHHLATHDFGDTAWTTPTYWMAGDNGPEFTESTSLAAKTIKKAQLLLNQNFNLKFTVDVPSGLSQEIIKERSVVVYQEGNPKPLGEDKYTMTGFQTNNETKEVYYEFTLTGIEPHYLGDNFEVIFTAEYALPEWDEVNQKWNTEGVTPIKVYEKRDYSVLDYCTRQLNRTKEELGFTSDDAYHKFVTLICNVLEYGAQYQQYRHAQTSAEPLSEDLLVSTRAKAKLENQDSYKPVQYWNAEGTDTNGNSIAPTATVEHKWVISEAEKNDAFYARSTLVSIGSENAMGLFFHIKDYDQYKTDNPVILTVVYADGTDQDYFISDLVKHKTLEDVYYVVGKSVSIVNYRKTSQFIVYAPVETDGKWGTGPKYEVITYSMESFVKGLLNSTDNRADLVKALWDYAYAALQYQNPESSDDDTTGGITLDTDNIFDADVWDKIETDSNYDPENPYTDTDGDKIPDSWVKLNISSSLARLLSIFNPLIRSFFEFELAQVGGVWYARPYGPDWSAYQ